MKNEFTITESMDLLDISIQKEMTEIFNLNHKAKNHQSLADEKYNEMANIFENMNKCVYRVSELYTTQEERALIRLLQDVIVKRSKINTLENIEET